MIGLPGALPQVRHGESVLWRTANDCCAVGAKHIPLDKGRGLRRGVVTPARANCPERFLTLPLSQTHSFALIGAGASVSPKGREKGEATIRPGTVQQPAPIRTDN